MHTSLLLLVLLATVAAQSTTTPQQQYIYASFVNDNNVLNFALTLENFEAEMYRRAVNTFNANSFTAAGYNASVYSYLRTLADQEAAHSSALNYTLGLRGWPAVQPCTYNFGNIYSSVNAFLTFAATIEQAGVSAYDGAVPYLSDPILVQYAATIATVEARHSAYLYALIGQTPFPNSNDPTVTPQQAFALVSPYLGSCPSSALTTGYNGTIVANSSVPVFPQFANATRQANSTYATNTPPLVNIATPAFLNDNRVLNLALSVETFCTYFYNFSLGPNGPVNATSLSAAGYDGPAIYNLYQTIYQQEIAHVQAIRMVLSARGAAYVQPCNYTFPDVVKDVPTFIRLSQMFELVGVQAYDGGIAAISDNSLATTAATFATVEGRHSAFVYNLTGLSPFPNTTDTPVPPADIIAMIRPYIYSCPSVIIETISNISTTSLNLTLPVVIDYFGQANQNLGAAQNALTGAILTPAPGANNGGNGSTVSNSRTGSTISNTYSTSTSNMNSANSAVCGYALVAMAVLALFF